MDGLKKFFRVLRRLHFWILCPLVVVMGLVGWFLTIGALNKQKQKNLSDINSKYSAMKTIAGTELHPNDKVHSGMDELIATRRNEVAAAWQEKWDQQTKEGGVLTWPDFQWKDDVKKEFMDRVRDLRPIESTVEHPLPRSKDLRIGLRRAYRDYIIDELPKLAEMIGAVWTVEEGARPGAQNLRGPQSLELSEAKVGWSPENQREILEAHFSWGGGAGGQFFGNQRAARTEDVPNLLEILYAQEDLWVLRAVMQVIDRANAGATARFNATVKEIEWLRIGKKAIPSAGHVARVAAEDATGEPGIPGMERMPGGEMLNPEMMMQGGEYQEGAMFGQQEPDPGEGRYVDQDYKVLEPGKLREVMTSGSVNPEDADLLVAKRIPVRMRLKVDQRKLHKLLLECANSELTIEVRQLRINPEDEAGGGIGRPGAYGEMGPIREFGPSRRGGNLGSLIDKSFSYEFTVEIYGIVYIYNPVNRAVLGDEEPPADEEELSDVALHDRARRLETVASLGPG